MIDHERFDDWVALNDNDEEALELVRVVVESMVLADALLGPKAAGALGREVVLCGIQSAYGSYADHEAQAHLDLGDPVSAVELVFDEVDLLNFEFAQKANGLKCYAMTGMIEGETPTATFEEKRDHLTDLVEWGRMICDMIPEERTPLPKFRSVCAAAEARLSIDLDHPVDTIRFAHLAALFREGTPDQVRKTLQNQISAKQLIVNERRELLPSSALQFLKDTPDFPSIWMFAEQAPVENEEVGEPVFVPVCFATAFEDARPFLPSEKHVDGYHVGAGTSAQTFDDYWQALKWLSQSPEPSFRPLGRDAPVRCREQWARVDRKLLENELASAPPLGAVGSSLTDQVHKRLMARGDIGVHPLGHSSKVYRYKLENGTELALEKRIGEPWLYARQSDLPAAPGVDYVDVPETKHGRNSNLNAMPTFAGHPLRKFRLKSVAELEAMLALL